MSLQHGVRSKPHMIFQFDFIAHQNVIKQYVLAIGDTQGIIYA